MLTEQVKNYITKNRLFNKQDKLLLALSGGCDSVALFHIFIKLNINFSAAHCNFKLRDTDSDSDELFVDKLCEKFNIPLFKTSFNTHTFAKNNRLSVEEAARKLRYDWFEKIRIQQNFSYITTAHHLNDKIETFFINLTKGTGIKGLRSISAKKNKLIRPLLFAKKEDIETWCSDNEIHYRTDQSNFDTIFLRNKFRHEILPVFKTINPKFQDSMLKNFQIFNEFENIYNSFIENMKKDVLRKSESLIYIDLEKLLKTPAPSSLLFEIIRLYGFKSSQNQHILNNINNLQTGKIFLSKTHRILKDKNRLIITHLKSNEDEIFLIDKQTDFLNFPIKLSFEKLSNIPEKLKTDTDEALINADKLTYPLVLRKAQKADFFYPFGMKGKKLLSDYFTDEKINLFEREIRWILSTDKNEIIWIIGCRTDNRFKINKNTKRILKIKQL